MTFRTVENKPYSYTAAELANWKEGQECIAKLLHRAEVAERAENELKLYKLAVKIWQERYSDIRCFNFNIALRQAEKELAEEKK